MGRERFAVAAAGRRPAADAARCFPSVSQGYEEGKASNLRVKRERLRAALRAALLLVSSFGHGKGGGGDLIDFRRRVLSSAAAVAQEKGDDGGTAHSAG